MLLAQLPTPLQRLPRLGESLGHPEIWIKRDDLTGLAMGGNKARKLEFLMADVRRSGADMVLTTGGAQSNHARMTAAAACRLGAGCHLMLCDEDPGTQQGNLLLDHLFGATVTFCESDSYAETDRRLAELADLYRSRGRHPYIIPVGGSTPLGCLGYYLAAAELQQQLAALQFERVTIVIAVGSTGTLAGLLLGAASFLPGATVFGISVSPPAEAGRRRCSRIMQDAVRLYNLPVTPPEPDIRDDWLGPAYGVATEGGLQAIRRMARLEGILLDPVYTGKAFHGLVELLERGCIPRDAPVIFWHTGGAPALFAFGDSFSRTS